MITPTFHFEILKKFYETMDEQACILVENLRQTITKNTGPLELLDFIKNCALDIICGVMHGFTKI